MISGRGCHVDQDFSCSHGVLVYNPPVNRFFLDNSKTIENTMPCSGSIGLGVDEERS